MEDTIKTSANSISLVLTLDNPAFSGYLICVCLLVLKMMGVSLLTIYNRFRFRVSPLAAIALLTERQKETEHMWPYQFSTQVFSVLQAFICPEDAKWLRGHVVTNDTVERMRRAHQNDVENIPIFFVAGFAYLWTQPYTWLAWALYIGFTVVRALHTIVYTLIILPQPARALFWLVGFFITGYMAIHAALHAFIHLVS